MGPSPLLVVNTSLTRTAAGAELSFEAVYQEYFEFVWCGLQRLGVPAEQLDDAVQDVFIVGFRRLSDFEGRSSLKTWLYGIAIKVARDHRRRTSRKPTEPLPPGLVDGAPGPHEAAVDSQALRVLHQLLSELSDEKREVFVLVELEQLTAPETAALLAINLTTVHSRLRVARGELAQAWERHHRRAE